MPTISFQNDYKLVRTANSPGYHPLVGSRPCPVCSRATDTVRHLIRTRNHSHRSRWRGFPLTLTLALENPDLGDTEKPSQGTRGVPSRTYLWESTNCGRVSFTKTIRWIGCRPNFILVNILGLWYAYSSKILRSIGYRLFRWWISLGSVVL